MWQKTSECRICGAPIYARPKKNDAPEVRFNCECRNKTPYTPTYQWYPYWSPYWNTITWPQYPYITYTTTTNSGSSTSVPMASVTGGSNLSSGIFGINNTTTTSSTAGSAFSITPKCHVCGMLLNSLNGYRCPKCNGA